MNRRLLFLLLLMVAVLFLALSCSDTTEPKRDVATPEFNPPGGNYTEGQQVTINCETEGATIHYTLDGNDPTEASFEYCNPIVIDSTATIKAIAVKKGWNNSDIATEEYHITGTVATPEFNPPGGSYDSVQNVTILCATEGATIRYTLNGEDPTENSFVYTTSIEVTETTTIKARAYKDGWDPSQVATAEYTIEDLPPETVATPTFNPSGGIYDTPQNVTISCATEGATIRYTLNGEDPAENSTVYTSSINISTDTTVKARGFKDGWDASQIAEAVYTIDDSPPQPEMIFVQGGTFIPYDNYIVTLSSFYIGKYEVTQSEWTSVMGGIYDPNWDYGHGPNHPAYLISWFDAIEYCNRLSIREGLTPAYSYGDSGTNPANWPAGWNEERDNHTNVSCNWNADGYRLPTEMEWEFAARGGVPAQNAGTFGYNYAGTNVGGTEAGQLGDYAWFRDNSDTGEGRQSHPVGTKLPNELGLYDMSGNVFNWVWDIWDRDYPEGFYNNPTGPTTGDSRVLRGGSWFSQVVVCRVWFRSYRNATFPLYRDGFRVSRTLN